MGVPSNSKLGVSVTQTSVVAVVADQSTHATYHIKDNQVSVLLIYCMMQWIKQLSLHIRLNICFKTNNQNRQQDKLVNMVNGSDLIKHNYWPYIYLTYVF